MSDDEQRIPTWPGPWILRYTLGVAAVVAAYAVAFVVTLRAPYSLTSQIIEGAMFFGLIAVLVFVLRLQRTFQSLRHETTEAQSGLARGELDYAREVFWRWSERTRVRRFGALTRHNLAWTLMLQGELQCAIDVLLDNDEHNAQALEAARWRTTSAADLAFDYALLGNLEEAERWMATAATREAAGFRPSYPAMRALARAVIDCRRGRTSEAARMLDELCGSNAEASTELWRLVTVVRRFAHADIGSTPAGTPAEFKPGYPGQLDFLGIAWPEMAAFLAAQDLTSSSNSRAGGAE